MRVDLSDRVAVVTGGRGIGEAVTVTLATAGSDVVVGDTCLFLVSYLATCVTGADLPVGGGANTTAGLYR